MWVSAPRVGSTAVDVGGLREPQNRWRIRSGGKPMSTTRTSPARSAPGSRSAPVFGAPNVTVSAASTASPVHRARTSRPRPRGCRPRRPAPAWRSAPRSAAAHSSSGILRNPVPKSASTAISARASSRRPKGRRPARIRASVSDSEASEVARSPGRAGPRGPRTHHHRDPDPLAREMPRGNEAVPSVVALAADDPRPAGRRCRPGGRWRPAPRPAPPVPSDRAAGTPPAWVARSSSTACGGREDRLHRSATATAKATAFVRSCVKVMRTGGRCRGRRRGASRCRWS